MVTSTFASTALTAVQAWRLVLVTSLFMIAYKDTLPILSVHSGLLLLWLSFVERNLAHWGFQFEFSIIQQKGDQYGHAEKYSVLWVSRRQC